MLERKMQVQACTPLLSGLALTEEPQVVAVMLPSQASASALLFADGCFFFISVDAVPMPSAKLAALASGRAAAATLALQANIDIIQNSVRLQRPLLCRYSERLSQTPQQSWCIRLPALALLPFLCAGEVRPMPKVSFHQLESALRGPSAWASPFPLADAACLALAGLLGLPCSLTVALQLGLPIGTELLSLGRPGGRVRCMPLNPQHSYYFRICALICWVIADLKYIQHRYTHKKTGNMFLAITIVV